MSRYIIQFLFFLLILPLYGQVVEDDFEGNSTITTWFGDNCAINTNYANPYLEAGNNSATVLRYHDTGGQYANVRFDVPVNFDLSSSGTFSLKIYVPSSSLTGNQPNQVSLKLQDGTIGAPWSTQSEIIKPISLNMWQELTFDFKNDSYINLDGSSLPPSERTDFNRVVIQVNGENNFDHVVALIDDFYFDPDAETSAPVFNQLIWSDEFDGTEINSSKWHHQTQLIAGDSWANGEQQHYTERVSNSYVSNGTLKIVAKQEVYEDQGHIKNYTSARLNSKFAFTYGRVEVRAKLPSIPGTWPAIWLLGKNINEDGAYWDNEGYGTTIWPYCGEIDIMEPNVEKTQILGTWHWNNGSGNQSSGNSLAISNTETSENYHIYALEWTAEGMKIYLDDMLVHQISTFDPFNNEFYILLNVAMGGNLGGPIASDFDEDVMEIDYVRVYQQSALSVNEDQDPIELNFYPNPVEDRLHFSTNKTTHETVLLRIVDLNGRIIFEEEHYTNNQLFSYDVRSLKSGLYLAKLIYSDGFNHSFKFIKK